MAEWANPSSICEQGIIALTLADLLCFTLPVMTVLSVTSKRFGCPTGLVTLSTILPVIDNAAVINSLESRPDCFGFAWPVLGQAVSFALWPARLCRVASGFGK